MKNLVISTIILLSTAIPAFADNCKLAQQHYESDLKAGQAQNWSEGEIGRPLALAHEARKTHNSPPKWIDSLVVK